MWRKSRWREPWLPFPQGGQGALFSLPLLSAQPGSLYQELNCLTRKAPQFLDAEASFSTASPVLGTQALQDTEDSCSRGQSSGVQLSGQENGVWDHVFLAEGPRPSCFPL